MIPVELVVPECLMVEEHTREICLKRSDLAYILSGNIQKLFQKTEIIRERLEILDIVETFWLLELRWEYMLQLQQLKPSLPPAWGVGGGGHFMSAIKIHLWKLDGCPRSHMLRNSSCWESTTLWGSDCLWAYIQLYLCHSCNIHLWNNWVLPSSGWVMYMHVETPPILAAAQSTAGQDGNTQQMKQNKQNETKQNKWNKTKKAAFLY